MAVFAAAFATAAAAALPPLLATHRFAVSDAAATDAADLPEGACLGLPLCAGAAPACCRRAKWLLVCLELWVICQY